MSEWIWIPRPRPAARLRLYCLAHAGAGASAFAHWAYRGPDDIEIAPVQLPGRENRMAEEPLRRLAALAEQIAATILAADERPFALFGHSAGGKLAMHVAARLSDGPRSPEHIFVSASPVAMSRLKPLHRLDRQEFIQGVSERFGALPPQLFEDAEVWDIFERVLRADLEALETDELAPRPLDVPLTVIGGARDTVIRLDDLAGWQAWARRPVRFATLDADHFSYRSEPAPYLRLIASGLSPSYGQDTNAKRGAH
jgi:medium-chain acyl-[acyl-carrier-protein] hydrolase